MLYWLGLCASLWCDYVKGDGLVVSEQFIKTCTISVWQNQQITIFQCKFWIMILPYLFQENLIFLSTESLPYFSRNFSTVNSGSITKSVIFHRSFDSQVFIWGVTPLIDPSVSFLDLPLCFHKGGTLYLHNASIGIRMMIQKLL